MSPIPVKSNYTSQSINSMNELIILSGRKSELECTFKNPIVLEKPHSIGLTDFVTYNSIPNVDYANQYFHFKKDNKENVIIIPQGAYELEDLEGFLKSQLGDNKISIKPNHSTLQCEIESSFLIDFTKPNSIGSLLGFSQKILQPKQKYCSDLPVKIMNVNVIFVECNIASGCYINGEAAHGIFIFSPTVPPGYKMVLSPKPPRYHKVNTHTIDRISINIKDQTGTLVNFGNEEVTVALHLKADG